MREFSRVQDQALSLDSFDPIQSFPECGGIDIFIGTVRNHHEGKAVKALKYTSYTPIAEKMIRENRTTNQREASGFLCACDASNWLFRCE